MLNTLQCGHPARAVVAAVVLCFASCSSQTSKNTETLAVAVTSHEDRAVVSDAFVLRGTAEGDLVEVAVDTDPFLPASRNEAPAGEWSFPIDASQWSFGWHFVRVRTIRGAVSSEMHMSLYTQNGYVEPVPPPIVVEPAPSVPPPPPTRGLVAHWDFLDGKAIDKSPIGIDGVLFGAPSAADHTVLFDGIDDEMRVPDAATRIGDLVCGTIHIRFQYNAPPAGQGVGESLPLFYYGADEATTQKLGWDCVTIYVSHGEMQNPDRRQVYFTVLNGTEITLCMDTTVSLVDGQWYDYTLVMQAGDHRAYLDGNEVPLHYNAGTSPDTHAFFRSVARPDMFAFGYGYFAFFDSWAYFDGAIDDIRIFDRLLTKAEVKALALDH